MEEIKIDKYGTKFYYKNGKFHRDNDLPAIEYANGGKIYYKNGKLHRDNGLPAIEYSNGTKHYYKNGKIHRDNGLPAVEYASGRKEYWYNDKKITQEDWIKRLKRQGKITEREMFIYYINGYDAMIELINKEK